MTSRQILPDLPARSPGTHKQEKTYEKRKQTYVKQAIREYIRSNLIGRLAKKEILGP